MLDRLIEWFNDPHVKWWLWTVMLILNLVSCAVALERDDPKSFAFSLFFAIVSACFSIGYLVYLRSKS